MHSYVVNRAAWLSEQVQQAQQAAPLDDAAGAFVEVLECFPDYPAATFSLAAMHSVRYQSQGVIEKLEQWVQANPEDRHNQRFLRYVYTINRAVERINCWQNHYVGSARRQSA